MVKIAFHTNQLCERGTTVCLFNYAYYNVEILKNESIILYTASHPLNVPEVVKKFEQYFDVFSYDNWENDCDEILKRENCDILYLQKAGGWDGKVSKVCKNIVHCVFNTSFEHGDVYGKISNSFGKDYPVVNYMVNLPDVKDDLRKNLDIPVDAVVFGRHGGKDQFNIPYVHSTIEKISEENQNIYFLFVNTNKFCKEKKNIIYLDRIIELEEKTKFINTCNAMIHARRMGETFGSAISEFSVKNKPIITCVGKDNAHLEILKGNCFLYDNEETLTQIIYSIYNNPDEIKKNWNQYEYFTPDNIMKEFDAKFIQPCLSKEE